MSNHMGTHMFINCTMINNTVNEFSITGMQSALAENGIPTKKMHSDIGIMQKLTTRIENGVTYYYTGMYTWFFNCIICT